ncbi:hypothetical protein K445DRAFT_69082, partial [Daldinia sp. EC12]
KAKRKTYNTEDSPVVTDPTTSSAVSSLSMGERTGSRVFCFLWSYVIICGVVKTYIPAFTRLYTRPLNRTSPSLPNPPNLVLCMD